MKIVKLAGAATIALAIASPALAQQTTPVVIEQVNLKDAFSNLNVNVRTSDESVIGVNSAISNTISAYGNTDGASARFRQTGAGATAVTNVANRNTDILATATTAQGNGLTYAVTEGRAGASIRQNTNGDILAENNIAAGSARLIEASTTATANVSTISSENSRVGVSAVQNARGDVRAINNTTARLNDEAATFVTTGTANSLSVEGYNEANLWDIYQNTQGHTQIEATSNVRIWDAANVTNATTAAGNSINVATESGFAGIGTPSRPSAVQTNNAGVSATANTRVDQLTGFASTTALGVGNSASLTNASSDESRVFLDQVNTGGVYAESNFQSGAAFGPIVSDATAVGNTLSLNAGANLQRSGGLTTGLTQTNSGHIVSNTNINARSATSVVGTASAIGNSATIIGSNGY